MHAGKHLSCYVVMHMPCALKFEGEGAEAASTRSRKTFFAKNVVGLMLQPLTLRKREPKLYTFLRVAH